MLILPKADFSDSEDTFNLYYITTVWLSKYLSDHVSGARPFCLCVCEAFSILDGLCVSHRNSSIQVFSREPSAVNQNHEILKRARHRFRSPLFFSSSKTSTIQTQTH